MAARVGPMLFFCAEAIVGWSQNDVNELYAFMLERNMLPHFSHWRRLTMRGDGRVVERDTPEIVREDDAAKIKEEVVSIVEGSLRGTPARSSKIPAVGADALLNFQN